VLDNKQPIRRTLGFALAGLIAVPFAGFLYQTARAASTDPPPVKMTSEQDHQHMMDLLHITALRPGRRGSDPSLPAFANYNETKANPYPNLPDPLKFKDGKKVATASDWWNKRRPEIVEDFDREVYGRVPKVTPAVKWEVTSTTPGKNGDVDIVTKHLTGVVDNSSYPDIYVHIDLTLVTPANAKGPVPVIMQFGGGGGGGAATPAAPGPPYGPNGFAAGGRGLGGGAAAGRGAAAAPPEAPAPVFLYDSLGIVYQAPVPAGRGGAAGDPAVAGARGAAGAARGATPGAPTAGGARRGGAVAGAPGAGRGAAGPSWQQQVLARGWGYAALNPGSIQADNGAGLDLGIIGLCNKGQPRKPDDWGALRAWAWGVSRAIDYFETDPAVDAKHIALEGHSRYGKATIVSMAYEPRLWTAYVSSSGEGGAKLHRRDWGEVIENVDDVTEYHWMAGNFLKYAGPLGWNDLPVDAHELVAMCAPRPVFLSAGAGGYDVEPGGDSWVDAKGTFMAGAAASPVYELLGKKGMGTNVFPPMETLVATGDVAFRQHSSGHTDGPNWSFFLDFAGKHM
jgi:hypothetical protein